ncbi:MAG: glycosyltransferase family 4 protein [Bacteroidales bacterium]|nr:glycosyltransferase family 4 protein [Bacteroidales bacterium]
MKILYDYQIFEHQSFGGISRYFSEIIDHLPSNIKTDIAIKFSDNVYLKKTKLVSEIKKLYDPRVDFLKGIEFKGKGRLFNIVKKYNPQKYREANFLNQKYTIESLRQQIFDVFHPTYYDNYFLKYLGNKPFVLTVHDMNHELFPEFYASQIELDFVKTKALLMEKAAHLIAVSENTKKDIIEILGINKEKISVIYHAVSLPNTVDIKKIQLPDKYLLYVGDRAAEYKNFKFMIRALTPILNEDSELKIICTGKEFDYKEINLFKSLGVVNQLISIFVDDHNLNHLYNCALAFIFPSYYEGFGLPILEAFKNECPVLLSSSSCFPEIAGDAAIFFEAKSMQSIRKIVRSIDENEGLRKELIKKGNKRLQHFSWEKAANQTAEIYQKVLKSE